MTTWGDDEHTSISPPLPPQATFDRVDELMRSKSVELGQLVKTSEDLRKKLSQLGAASASASASSPRTKTVGGKKGKGGSGSSKKAAAAAAAASTAQSEEGGLLDVDDIDVAGADGEGAGGGGEGVGGGVSVVESVLSAVVAGGQSAFFLAVEHRAVWLFGLVVFAIQTRGDVMSI